MLIMTIGLLPYALPDALEPGFHCVRTQWIRGFIAFELVRRTRTAMLMVPMCPGSGFLGRAARPRFTTPWSPAEPAAIRRASSSPPSQQPCTDPAEP
jgi:hypothetical protein